MTDTARETIITATDEQRPDGLTMTAYRPEVVLKGGDSGPWCVRLVDALDPLEPATGWHDVATTSDARGRPRWVEISPAGERLTSAARIHYSDPLPRWVAPAVLEIIRARFDRSGIEVKS